MLYIGETRRECNQLRKGDLVQERSRRTTSRVATIGCEHEDVVLIPGQMIDVNIDDNQHIQLG